MAIDLSFYNAVQGVDSWTERDYADEKDDIADGLRTSTNYIPNGKINGKPAELVVTGTDEPNIVKIIAFPDISLTQGDYVTFNGKTAIVTETMAYQPFQVYANAFLCNFTFRWQNAKGEIIEKLGVYSSSYNSTNASFSGKVSVKEFSTITGQTRIFLPYDDDTKYLYIDKRLAISNVYDKYGKRILKVDKIIGIDFSACNYYDGHLAVFNLAADFYNENTDNIELMICDYIDTDEKNNTQKIKGVISGRTQVPVGTTRKYTVKYYDSEREIDMANDTQWKVLGKDFEINSNDDYCEVVIPDKEEIIGEGFILEATNGDVVSKMEVEVVGL